MHLHAWVPIPAKGELPCHSTTTTFVPFHYLISHAPALRSFLICMVITLSLSLFKEWIWQCPFCFIYWLFCFVLKMILSLFIPSQRGCRSSDELPGESPHKSFIQKKTVCSKYFIMAKVFCISVTPSIIEVLGVGCPFMQGSFKLKAIINYSI